jgi:superfamily II RNA helicase
MKPKSQTPIDASQDDPPEIKAMAETLTAHNQLTALAEETEAIASSARGEIESFAADGNLKDIEKLALLAPRKLQAELADLRIQAVSEKREAVEQQLAEQRKPAAKVVLLALRKILKLYIARETEILLPRFGSDRDKAAQVAAGAAAPTQAQKRYYSFEWLLKYQNHTSTELADEILHWWSGVKTELSALEADDPVVASK